MKRLTVFSLAAVLVLGLTAGAWALPFPITDVRALGMGGAFVAAGDGIGAVQYNPALLGEDTTVEVVAPNFVARAEDQIGLSDLIDDLNNLAPTDTTQAFAILNKLDQGGIELSATWGAGAGFGVFGIAAGVTYGEHLYGQINPTLVTPTLPGLIDSTLNQLAYGGIEIKQLVFSGAKSFGNIIVGANLRQLDGTTYYDQAWLFQDPDVGLGDATDVKLDTDTATAIDVGILFGLVPMVDIGIMARDLNAPELAGVEFDPMYRVGAAINLPMVTIAADLDVSENAVDGGSDYKEWAIGAEFDLWAIALRAGMSKNTSLSSAPTLLHFGLGLGFMDLGFAYAEEGDFYLAGLNFGLGF